MPFLSASRRGLPCMDCFYSVVYPYRNGEKICLSKFLVYRGIILLYSAFVVTPCHYYCMGLAEFILFCIFSLLCVLYSIYYFSIEITSCCHCALYMGCVGIYTVFLSLRISVVIYWTHSVPVPIRDTNF